MTKKKSETALSAIETASPREAAEAVYFARKCGLTPDEALSLIREARQAPPLHLPGGGRQER